MIYCQELLISIKNSIDMKYTGYSYLVKALIECSVQNNSVTQTCGIRRICSSCKWCKDGILRGVNCSQLVK